MYPLEGNGLLAVWVKIRDSKRRDIMSLGNGECPYLRNGIIMLNMIDQCGMSKEIN